MLSESSFLIKCLNFICKYSGLYAVGDQGLKGFTVERKVMMLSRSDNIMVH